LPAEPRGSAPAEEAGAERRYKLCASGRVEPLPWSGAAALTGYGAGGGSVPRLVIRARSYDEVRRIGEVLGKAFPGLEVRVVSDLEEQIMFDAVGIGIAHSGLLEAVQSEEYRRSLREAREVCLELERFGLRCV